MGSKRCGPLIGVRPGSPGWKAKGVRCRAGYRVCAGFVASQAVIDAPEHHVDLGVLEVEAEERQRGSDLLLRDAHGLLRLSLRAAPAARRRLGRGPLGHRKHTEYLKPGPAIHKVQ